MSVVIHKDLTFQEGFEENPTKAAKKTEERQLISLDRTQSSVEFY